MSRRSASALAPYGWGERVLALVASASDPGLPVARVARVDRGALTAVSEAGVVRLPTRGLQVTAGDWILLAPSDPPAVAEVLPRWSALHRHDPGRAAVSQLLAANVDVGFLVAGLDRGPSLGRLERLLTLLWSAGATPVVVLTKADLAAAPDDTAAEVERATVGVEVVVASSVDGRGVNRLRELVPRGQTAVLLGESGAGKSSLVNALIGADVQATADVRAGDHKGRHTTRARELVPLPGAGVLLDTPGLRGVALAADQEGGVNQTFSDVTALAAGCRFGDCRHAGEPGCAVRAAVDAGTLAEGRLASFHALEREVADAARRAERDRRRRGRGS